MRPTGSEAQREPPGAGRMDTRLVLGSYLLLSATPFLPMLFGRAVSLPWQTLAMEAACWLTAWSLLGRPARFHWMLLPAFLFLPVELFLGAEFSLRLNAQHLGIISESTPREAIEFFGKSGWLLGGYLLFATIWWAACWRSAFRATSLAWRGWTRWACLAGAALVGIAAALLHVPGEGEPATAATASSDDAHASPAPGAGHSHSPESDSPATGPAVPASGWRYWLSGGYWHDPFSRSRPFGLMVLGYDFWLWRQYLATIDELTGGFRFGATQAEAPDQPRLVVLVIGESSRRDRWSLYGYARETNPLLSREPNLIALNDVLTPVSSTRIAVPVMLTRKPALASLEPGFAERSVISAYREAGYKTFWLSNQLTFGRFDTPMTVLAREAEVVRFLNPGGYERRSELDEALLPPLKAALDDPAPRKLVVIHTLGSHWNYAYRHPPAFERWTPSLRGTEAAIADATQAANELLNDQLRDFGPAARPLHKDPRRAAEIGNSYDNSILYTDWLLSRFIASVKASGPALSTLVYVSDHGENLVSADCDKSMHGSNTEHDYRVPMLAWHSDGYAARHPDLVARLVANRDAKLTLENLFHTLVDMGGLRYPGHRSERSIASPGFREQVRYVNADGWIDFDQARPTGGCRVVTPPGAAATPRTAGP